jgi:hypothetical protein
VAPPTLNLDNGDAASQGVDIVAREARPMPMEYAISNGFGFGGSTRASSCDVGNEGFIPHVETIQGAPGDPVELFEREQFLAWQKRHRLGHAVSASQIATIRHRQPQVFHAPAKPINKRN